MDECSDESADKFVINLWINLFWYFDALLMYGYGSIESWVNPVNKFEWICDKFMNVFMNNFTDEPSGESKMNL